MAQIMRELIAETEGALSRAPKLELGLAGSNSGGNAMAEAFEKGRTDNGIKEEFGCWRPVESNPCFQRERRRPDR